MTDKIAVTLSGFASDTLHQLFYFGPIADGDLASKTGRDELHRMGLATRRHGFSQLTEQGLEVALAHRLDLEKEKRQRNYASFCTDGAVLRKNVQDFVDSCVANGFVSLGARVAVENAKAAVAVTDAAPPTAPNSWRPIETAPRDGRHILLRMGSETVTLGWWDPNAKNGLRYPWQFVDTGMLGTGYVNGSGINSIIDGRGGGPTHWRPLPSGEIVRA
jgi:hypothetical protein